MNTYNHINILKKLLSHVGISGDRIQQYFCSAADVEKFVKAVEDITRKVETLPPLPRFNPNESDLFK